MAVGFLASIYGINSNALGGAAGTLISFPASSVLVRPVNPAQTFNGVTVLSIIQLIPGGTVVNQPQYYAAASVTTINTARNA